MAGSPSPSLRPPANRRPRSRRRGKGAKGGRSSGSPCGAVGASGSGPPLPFPSSSSCCSGFFCERRGQSSATGRAGLESFPPTPRPRSRAAPGSTRGGGSRGGGDGSNRGRRWARPVVPVKGERAAADLPGPSRAHFYGAVRPWISNSCPKVAETEQGLDFCEQDSSTGTCSSRTAAPSGRRHRLTGTGVGKQPRSPVVKSTGSLWTPSAREPSTR